MKNFVAVMVFTVIVFLNCGCFADSAAEKADTLLYLDANKPIDARVEDLLGRMTLEEKVAQMHMTCSYIEKLFGSKPAQKFEKCKKLAQGSHEHLFGPIGGFKHTANQLEGNSPSWLAESLNELQKIATQKTRLKIPLMQVGEGTHGFMCSGATIFPEGLAIGSTWNTELIEKIYTVAAKEARSVGTHELSTLVVEPIRDPRLGRNEEAFAEDTYLCSRIIEAVVKGCQGQSISAPDRVIAELSHFPGQSEPTSGIERGTMEISERQLREVFLPPWEAGIKKCGALGVMATYAAIDGMPAHASRWMLTQLLREELGFKGLVLSEGGGLNSLVYEGVAADQKEAGVLALNAGLDVSISFEDGYGRPLLESIREGKVSIERVNTAVRRILRIKFMLGLFENPFVDPNVTASVFHSKEHQQLALQVAHEGMVLLKNEKNLLPLDKNIKSIAVIGPCADHQVNQLGDYTAKRVTQDIVTILDGIKNKVSSAKVSYVKGCDVLDMNVNEISQAVDAAKNSEIAVVVLGENEFIVPPDLKTNIATNGEGFDSATLELTGRQQELVEAVYQTGTPTIVVLITGRPLAVRWIADKVPAILQAWKCGEKGGDAVADIIFGDCNPSGKLAITMPRHVGQLPVYYNCKPSKTYWIEKGWGQPAPYVDMSPKPLYEFGYGLSYTTFEYSDLKIKPAEPAEKISTASSVRVSLDVKNTGNRQGSEVVQLYIRDVVSSVVRPVKELKGFRKIALEPGEKKSVEFILTPYELSFVNHNMQRIVEPGKFEIMVGASSQDIRLKGDFLVE